MNLLVYKKVFFISKLRKNSLSYCKYACKSNDIKLKLTDKMTKKFLFRTIKWKINLFIYLKASILSCV